MRITVRYWRGTIRLAGHATTYRGAMRIASRNQNAFPAKFEDPQGRELIDDGHGLAYQDEADKGQTVYAC